MYIPYIPNEKGQMQYEMFRLYQLYNAVFIMIFVVTHTNVFKLHTTHVEANPDSLIFFIYFPRNIDNIIDFP